MKWMESTVSLLTRGRVSAWIIIKVFRALAYWKKEIIFLWFSGRACTLWGMKLSPSSALPWMHNACVQCQEKRRFHCSIWPIKMGHRVPSRIEKEPRRRMLSCHHFFINHASMTKEKSKIKLADIFLHPEFWPKYFGCENYEKCLFNLE